jgi:hypothetical protein
MIGNGWRDKAGVRARATASKKNEKSNPKALESGGLLRILPPEE